MKVINFFRQIGDLLLPLPLIRNHLTNWAWDKKLKELMGKYEFKNRNQFSVELGPYKLWIENHSFCSFHPYGNMGFNVEWLPSKITAIKAWKKLNRECPMQPQEQCFFDAVESQNNKRRK